MKKHMQSSMGKRLLAGAALGTLVGLVVMAGRKKNWLGTMKEQATRLKEKMQSRQSGRRINEHTHFQPQATGG